MVFLCCRTMFANSLSLASMLTVRISYYTHKTQEPTNNYIFLHFFELIINYTCKVSEKMKKIMDSKWSNGK